MTRSFINDTRDIDEETDEFDDEFDDEPADDGRWRWVAAVAAIVLAAAVIATMMILGGGDSGPTAGKVVPETSRPAPPPAPSPSPPPAPSATSPVATASLPPETFTSVPPTTTSDTPTAEAAPPVDSRTIVYTITGNHHIGDLVTVTYTDEHGALRTDLDVPLPWSRTVVLDPNTEIGSVTALSLASQLNCSITDAQGATIASQNLGLMATTCNR
jgi:hypothetical protein